MRLIDADAMKEWLDEYLSVFKKYDKSEVKGFVDHQPSIDIVRCAECAFKDTDRCPMDEVYLGGINTDDFCSYGQKERASDERV